MTPEEIEAQAGNLAQLLAASGITLEGALTAEGRDRATPRFHAALERARRHGYQELATRIEGMIAAEAQRHARREQRRLAIRATAGDRQDASPPPTVAPPLPVVGGPDTLGLDYSRTPGRGSPLSVLGRVPRGELTNPTGGLPSGDIPRPEPMPLTLTGIENQPPPTQPPPPPRTPPMEMTATGWENAPPPGPPVPPTGTQLAAMLTGFINPFNLTPPDTTVMNSPGQTLTGRVLPPVPTRLSFRTDAPEAEDAGRLLAVTGPAGRLVGRGVDRIVRTAAHHPTIAGLLTAGGVTTAGTSQAEPPNQLETARKGERTARTAHETLLKRQAELQAAFDRYDPARITGLGREEQERAVRGLQEELRRLTDERGQPLYRGRVDGNWGGQTTAAAAARREQIRIELETARSDLAASNKDLEGRGSRVRSFEREERVRAAENNLPGWARFTRDYSLPLSLVAGGIAGPLVRWPTRRGVENLRTERVRTGNEALTMGAGDEVGRAANANAFYNRGGGPDPFRVDRTSPLGFAANANQVPASSLYPVGNSWMQGPDYARMTGIGLGIGFARERHQAALHELEEARRDVATTRNPTQDQLDRMTRAAAMVEVARLAVSTAQTSVFTYPTAAAAMRYRSTATPHTNIAEGEVMRLNNLLAQHADRRPWGPPRATDITPNIRPDPSAGGTGFRRATGHFASAEEVELYRMMEESRRLSRR